MAQTNYKSVLADFIADINAKNFTDAELLKAYPEFNNDKSMLDAAYSYAATVKAKKYDEATLQSKFPEFFPKQSQASEQTPTKPRTNPDESSSGNQSFMDRFAQAGGGGNAFVPQTAQGIQQAQANEESKRQELERQASAQLPMTDQDRQQAAEIQRLQAEGAWGKANGVELGINPETGMPTITETQGDGVHLSTGVNANQSEIDRMQAQQPSYMTRPNDTEENIIQNIRESWTANTPEGQKAAAELEQRQNEVITELRDVFNATERGKEINTRYSEEYQDAFREAYGSQYSQAQKQIGARYMQAFKQSDAYKQIIEQYQQGKLTEAQANSKLDQAFESTYGKKYEQEANEIRKQLQAQFDATDKAKDINARHQAEYGTAFEDEMGQSYQDQMGGILQAFDKQMMDANRDFYEGSMRKVKYALADKSIKNTEKLGNAVFKVAAPTSRDYYQASIGNLSSPNKDPYLGAYNNFLYKAKQRMNDMRADKYQVGDFGKNVAYDLGGILEGTMSFGLSDYRDRKVITDIFQKVNAAAEKSADPEAVLNNPESVLNDKERAVYEAYCTMLAADLARQTDTSYLADAARLTAEMIPFMVEVGAMNGIFGGLNRKVQEGIARGITRNVLSKVPKGVVNRTSKLTGAVMNLANAGMYAVESGAMAFVLPRTYANMLQNKIDVADEPGAITLTKDKLVINDFDVNSTPDAFWKAWRDQWKELFTETGGVFNIAGGVIFKNPLVKQISRKINQTDLGKLIDTFSSGKFFEYAKQMGYHGTYKEWLEEVEGACWDYAFGDKSSFENFFSADTQIPMLISFSVPAVLGGGINAAQELHYRREYKSASDNVMSLLQKYGYSAEDLQDIKQGLYTTNVEDLQPEIIRMASAFTNAENLPQLYSDYQRLQIKSKYSSLTDEEKNKLETLRTAIFNPNVENNADAKALATELTKLAYSELALSSVDRDMAKNRARAIEDVRQYYREARAEHQAQQTQEPTAQAPQAEPTADVVPEPATNQPAETAPQAEAYPFEQEEQHARQFIQEQYAPLMHSDGKIYQVKLAGDDSFRRGYIVGEGNVVVDNSDPENPRITNDDTVTVKWANEDGTFSVTQHAAKDLDLADMPTTIDALTEQAIAPIRTHAEAAQAFPVGSDVEILSPDGTTYQTKVVSVSPEGVTIEDQDIQGNPITTTIPNNIALETLRPIQRQAQQAQEPTAQAPQVNQPAAPQAEPTADVVPEPATQQPNIDNMSAEEFGRATVEYMGDKDSAKAYLESERDKADEEVQRTAKLKVENYNGMDDWKRQNDAIVAQRVAAQNRYNKLQEAIRAVENYQTAEEQAAQAEKERLAAEKAKEKLNKQIRKQAKEFSDKLGVPIVVFDGIDEIPASQAKARAAYEQVGDQLDAWFDPATNTVYVNLNSAQMQQEDGLRRKVFHEVVGHQGLRTLLGKDFNKMLDAVWNSMTDEQRAKYLLYAQENYEYSSPEQYQRVAAEEFMAFTAEQYTALDDADQSAEAQDIRSTWQKICDLVREIVYKVFGNVNLSDNDIATLIQASYLNLKQTAKKKEPQAPAPQDEKQEALGYLNEALEEVSGGEIPANITIDENTIRDDENSAEMDAQLLIDGKPSNLLVTIVDQSLGARGQYEPANEVKFYPQDNSDWTWEKAEELAEKFNQGEHAGKASVLDESDAVYFYSLQAAMEFADFVNEQANAVETQQPQAPTEQTDEEIQQIIKEQLAEIKKQLDSDGYKKELHNRINVTSKMIRNGIGNERINKIKLQIYRDELSALNATKPKRPKSRPEGLNEEPTTEEKTAQESDILSKFRDLAEQGDSIPYLQSLTDEEMDALEKEVEKQWTEANNAYKEANGGRNLIRAWEGRPTSEVAKEFPREWQLNKMRNLVVSEQSRRYDMEKVEEAIVNRKPAESEELQHFFDLRDAAERAQASKSADLWDLRKKEDEYLLSLSIPQLMEMFEEAKRLLGEHDVPLSLWNAIRSKNNKAEIFDYAYSQQGLLAGKANKPKINIKDWVVEKKDTTRPAIRGVYHDPSGVGVASDAHIMIVSPTLFDKEHEGKSIMPDGNEAGGNFPVWQSIVDNAHRVAKQTVKVDWNALRNFIQGCKDKMKADGEAWTKNNLSDITLRLPNGDMFTYRLNKFIPFAEAAATFGADELHFSDTGLCYAENGKDLVLVMSLTEDRLDDVLPYAKSDEYYYHFLYDASGKQPAPRPTNTLTRRKRDGNETETSADVKEKMAKIIDGAKKLRPNESVFVMFRNGKTYEIYGEDAIKAGEILGIEPTEKDGTSFVSFPSGDPDVLSENLRKLIANGIKVGIAPHPGHKPTKGDVQEGDKFIYEGKEATIHSFNFFGEAVVNIGGERFRNFSREDLYEVLDDQPEQSGEKTRFSITKNEKNLRNSKESSNFAPKKKLTKRELAVAYSDMFRKKEDGQFADGNGFAFSANFFHLFERGRIVESVQIEGNEVLIKDIERRYGTNENTTDARGWAENFWRSQRANSSYDGIPQGQRGGNAGTNGVHGEGAADGSRDNQEIGRNNSKQVAGDNDPRFSVGGTQVVPIDGKSLVGLHNISAEKLRKALKMGGLANPSTAVIDLAKQNHEQYGDISLIMPSSLVDSKTGRNAGTFTGDIWSPTYPSVERIMSDKGDDAYYAAITKAFGDNEARRPILSRAKLDFVDYLDRGNARAGLAYWYLLEKGIEPDDVYYNSGVPEDIKRRFEQQIKNGLMDITDSERSALLSLTAELEGKTADDLLRSAQEAKQKFQEAIANPNIPAFRKNIAQRAIDEIDYYGVQYNVLSNGYHAIKRAVDNDGKIDVDSTLIAAQDIVQTQHQADFDKWLSDMDERFDISEVLFIDYDREGNRKYKPNTLANASRIMNNEDLQNAGNHGGFSATRGILMKRLETLADVRAEKGRLRPEIEEDIETEEWNKMQDEWFEKVLNPLSDMQKISDNSFSNVGYAETRLQEALRTKDPIATLNKEYGYHIAKDSQWAKDLADMVERVKNLSTKYFETKFRRPVYLNEFRNAVVPNNLPSDVREGLEKAGLTLFEYDPKEEGARRNATIKATEGEGIRFSVSSLENDRTLTKVAREEMQQIKDAALADGTFMKAPNGKRSNLNERQWLQVRTRAFKRMYGDWENDPENATKVLDENGEPMVVYHGTNRRFNIFKYGDLGFHFGTYEQADEAASKAVRWNQSGRYNVMPVFLDIRKPFKVDYDPETWNDPTSSFLRQLRDENIIDKKDWDGLDYDGLSYVKMRTIREKLQAAGYDGVIYPNWFEFHTGEDYRTEFDDSYIALNPNQIKSATHNDGSFSEDNDDIRFSISNETEDIFFSNAERAVEGIKQDKATPEQWLAMIEKAGGLKAGEDKWIGLSEWIKAQKPKLTLQPGETRSEFAARAEAENKRFTISKQDILDYIRQNKIQIEEVEYREYQEQELFEDYRREYKQYYDEAVAANEEDPQEVAFQRMIDEHGDDFAMGFYAYGDELQWDGDSDYIKWELQEHGLDGDLPINNVRLEYTTEGLNNKREIALTVPTIESWKRCDETHFGDAGEGRAIAWVRFGDAKNISKPKELQQIDDEYKELHRAMLSKYGLTYIDSDMSDAERQQERDLIARFNQVSKDHPQVEEKVLVIDEIQSNRHQEGREKGYKNDSMQPKADEMRKRHLELVARRGELSERDKAIRKAISNSPEGRVLIGDDGYVLEDKVDEYNALFDANEELHAIESEKREVLREIQELENEMRQMDNAYSALVPAAPFEKNWHELAMKRILRFAAENGYDKVAWTTGEQQSERYNIGGSIKEIKASDWDDTMGEPFEEDKPCKEVYAAMVGEGELQYIVNQDGTIVSDINDQYAGRKLSDVVGKELAIKLLSDGKQSLSGEGLRIGGEGMKGFYDEMLPRFMQKYGKKWGVQVSDVVLPDLREGAWKNDENGLRMHSIDITPEMRESVMEGQPMFSISRRSNGTIAVQPGETRLQYAQRIAEEIKRQTPKNTSLDEAIRFSITVNHNSPYLLKRADGAFVDPETGERLGFDHRFMGKGEGGQAHGYGSYFSKKDIREYADNGDVNNVAMIKEMFDTSMWKEREAFFTAGMYMMRAQNQGRSSFKKFLEDEIYNREKIVKSDEESALRQFSDEHIYKLKREIAEMTYLLEDLRKDMDMRLRHHYSVEIPDNNGGNYLIENEKLSGELLDKVSTAIADLQREKAKTIPEYNPTEEELKEYGDMVARQLDGRNAYGYFERELGNGEAASKFLNEHDIVGIKYDGRMDGECYVIFDPNDAKITDHIRFSITYNPSEDNTLTPDAAKEMQEIMERAKANGTYMKAPNGNPTNLTKRQWLQVRTNAFKRYFGDWENDPEHASKLVDANGEPLVAYHGTWNDFYTFDSKARGSSSGDNGFFGQGHYFTFGNGQLSREEARYYGGRIIDAFLNIRNPFMFKETIYANYNPENGDASAYGGSTDESLSIINYVRNFPELVKGITMEHVDKEEETDKDYSLAEYVKIFEDTYKNKEFIIQRNVDPNDSNIIRVCADPHIVTADNGYSWTEYGFEYDMYEPSEKADAQFVYTHYYLTERSQYSSDNGHPYFLLPHYSTIHNIAESDEFTAALKERGYDGVLQSALGDEAVAFEPNQIKSATENNGEFDDENNDIRFSITAKMDADYEKAVATGNETKIRKLVNEAAKMAMPNTKVVDKKGNPLVVYHGTPNKEFFEFNKDYNYFTSKESNANEYQVTRGALGAHHSDNGHVVPVYLNLENPFILDVHGKWNKINAEEVLKRLGEEADVKYLATYDVARMAKRKGYDGVIFKNISDHVWDGDNNQSDVYVAFYPNQIKGLGTQYAIKDQWHYPWGKEIYITSKYGATYDNDGNLIPLSKRFDLTNNDIRFSVNDGESVVVPILTRSEAVTRALVNNAKDDYNSMQAALKKVSMDIKGIREAMQMQSEYDRNTVDALLNLYRTLTDNTSHWASPKEMPYTTAQVFAQIRNAIGKKDISYEVNKIMDYITSAQVKVAKMQWDKLRRTPVEKINISGVVTQGKVALQGQYALKALNEAIERKLSAAELEHMVAEYMQMEDEATDESLRTQYKGQWIGYTIAAQHLERLEELKQERDMLDLEMKKVANNKVLKPQARLELANNIKEAIHENTLEAAEAYMRSARDLQEYVTEQHSQANGFIERINANREKIRSYATNDLAGIATNPMRARTKQSVARSVWDAFSSPIRDLQSMLRMVGLHAPDGEGYLYNHFMRNWMNSADEERVGLMSNQRALDEKVAELTNGKYKTWEEVARKIKDASHDMFSIDVLNGMDEQNNHVIDSIPLDAGNALYIYAINKMRDGKIKLNAMNIADSDVQALADQVREKFGKEILDIVDWVQKSFFSELRNRYNPTHEALFGAPMDAIENYFPLRINANARPKDEDLSDNDTDASRLLSGTTTGAIKRRTRNALPIDVRNADFFQEVIRHIAQMERWNAFAQWTRDANILFSDINFRNRVKGLNTIYGTGDELYNYMKDAFKVAVGTYKPQTDTFSKITLNMAKGVTSAKINFRVFTALKQIASFPAFFTYINNGKFVSSYLRNWALPHDTMKWAKENLPNFEKRVNKRDMGDMRLMQRSTDWQWNKRILEWSSKYGMAANVFFDTLTCATGARAVYDSRLEEYLKKGYSQEQAEQRARQDAEQAFNTSQQSSEGAFMAPVQMDRNLVTAALTVFRTSPIQYTRNFFYHTRNLLRKVGEGKEQQIAFRMGQYMEDGLSEEQARKAAEFDFNKSIRQDIVGIVVYGALLNIVWRLVGQFPYLVFGGDDDKKKKIVEDAITGGAFVSPITGLIGGSYIESALDGNGAISSMFAPELPFTQDAKRAEQYLQNNKYAEFASQALSLLMQSGIGFDPMTAADMITRTVGTLDSEQELDAAEQAIRLASAVVSIPQSQYEQMLIDRVAADDREYDAALEDYIRYQKIHTAPLTWYLRDEENDWKAEEKAQKRFDRLLNERYDITNPQE